MVLLGQSDPKEQTCRPQFQRVAAACGPLRAPCSGAFSGVPDHTLDQVVKWCTVPPLAAAPSGWLNRTVLGAGVTSALGDFCYETTR